MYSLYLFKLYGTHSNAKLDSLGKSTLFLAAYGTVQTSYSALLIHSLFAT